MIKHIVMWTLKTDSDKGTPAENAAAMKEKLEALVGKIPQIRELEVGVEVFESAPQTDAILYSVFDSREDLKAYATHPLHLEVVEFVKAVAAERRVVDYEI
ncbi:Dabb family protein [Oceanidesulfovibrio indonesiensis]|uniref:Dabb family protein n=1 Tax=Oceanidesulfovibrio indonesiensis TaxID=54767 RepID=A0A7M3MIT6_9BACT|nr:Dabb family protein [Oceanidesulfovibrio indonesiensis]TVM19310.1 Dabb family protein [Oceanidesulfovibrio indonesiensis]